ncbi:transcription-repair coupling factor, partial [Winogradskyella sp.]|nr:transcription-repair coupling factor [Winogradskyella sp.]
KETEFSDLYKDDGKPRKYVKDVTIDTDFELLFPDDYINNITERLNLYTKLNAIKTEEELAQFETEIIDRFGELPTQVSDLLDSVKLKWIATKMGVEKLIMKQGKLIGYFIQDQQSGFYQSDNFSKVLQFAQLNAKKCKMKEKKTRNGLRLLITFEGVTSTTQALNALSEL